MKIAQIPCMFLLLLCGCKNTSHQETSTEQRSNVDVANRFVDAFYSFNRDSLHLAIPC